MPPSPAAPNHSRGRLPEAEDAAAVLTLAGCAGSASGCAASALSVIYGTSLSFPPQTFRLFRLLNGHTQPQSDRRGVSPNQLPLQKRPVRWVRSRMEWPKATRPRVVLFGLLRCCEAALPSKAPLPCEGTLNFGRCKNLQRKASAGRSYQPQQAAAGRSHKNPHILLLGG